MPAPSSESEEEIAVVMSDAGGCDGGGGGAEKEKEPTTKSLRKGSSVSELVRSYDDGAGKRDRSESGDSMPVGKRRQALSSPRQTAGEVRELIEDTVEGLESRLSLFLSQELHELKTNLVSKFEALNARIKDLEDHVNEKDIALEKMAEELKETQEEVRKLNDRSEHAEMNSRIPCLVLSGRAMAPRRGPRLAAPLQLTGRPAPQGTSTGSDGPSGSSRHSSSAGDRGGGGSAAGGRGEREVEDVNSLVISVVRERFRGLDIADADIDRAHRLPGPNNRIIIRFVRSGAGSVRDQLMMRRMELRGSQDLYINESLTAQRSKIQRSLLEAKKNGQLYTVFTRWGHVYYKAEKFGTSTRVDSLEKVRQLGFAVKE